MRRKLQFRLEPDTDIILQEISEEIGESQSYTINQIIRDYSKARKEGGDLRAAVTAARAAETAARAAEEQARLIQGNLNIMLFAINALAEKTNQSK